MSSANFFQTVLCHFEYFARPKLPNFIGCSSCSLPRAGTGLEFSGLGRAWALGFGLGSGSDIAILGVEPVGLCKF